MTEEEFALLFRLLVEYCPPDARAAQFLWRRIVALLERENKKESYHDEILS